MGIIAQFYAILLFLIFNARKFELECALSSPLGCRNHRRGFGGGITLQIGEEIRFCLPSCICIHALAYASPNHAYAAFTLRMHTMG